MEGLSKIAYCGLYCPMCSFIAACETKDRAHLSAMPEQYDHLKQHTFEECACPGCREQQDRCHCAMKPCAESKGFISCADCKDFPCQTITDFGDDGAPHHSQAVQNLWKIKEIGYDMWQQEMDSQCQCECGYRQSWYLNCPAHS